MRVNDMLAWQSIPHQFVTTYKYPNGLQPSCRAPSRIMHIPIYSKQLPAYIVGYLDHSFHLVYNSTHLFYSAKIHNTSKNMLIIFSRSNGYYYLCCECGKYYKPGHSFSQHMYQHSLYHNISSNIPNIALRFFFYSSGLSLNQWENEYLQYLTQNKPSYYNFITKIEDDAHAVQANIIAKCHKATACAISFDGWTKFARHFFGFNLYINGKHYFLDFIRALSQKIDSICVKQILNSVITTHFLSEKFFFIVTDGGGDVRRAVTTSKYPWFLCTAHLFNRILTDLFTFFPEIISILERLNILHSNIGFVNFLKNQPNSKYKNIRSFNRTRWTSAVACVERALKMKKIIKKFNQSLLGINENDYIHYFFENDHDYPLYIITPSDMDVLKTVNKLFSKIYTSFLLLQKDNVVILNCLPIFNSIYSEIYQTLIEYDAISQTDLHNLFMESCHTRLNKYINSWTGPVLLGGLLNLEYEILHDTIYSSHEGSVETFISTLTRFDITTVINELYHFMVMRNQIRQQQMKNEEYWEKIKLQFPNLYILYNLLNVTPATTARTEGEFSKIKKIFRDDRANLSDQRIRNLAILYGNKNVLHEYFEQLISENSMNVFSEIAVEDDIDDFDDDNQNF